MRQELHQASRLGPKDNTASESSQVTYTSITSKPSTCEWPSDEFMIEAGFKDEFDALVRNVGLEEL